MIPLWLIDYLERNGRDCEARQCVILGGPSQKDGSSEPIPPYGPDYIQPNAKCLSQKFILIL